MSIAGEEGDVSAENVESWQERVKVITRGYAPQDVWNEDGTGSFWKAQSEKSLSEKEKRCRGGQKLYAASYSCFLCECSWWKGKPSFDR